MLVLVGTIGKVSGRSVPVNSYAGSWCVAVNNLDQVAPWLALETLSLGSDGVSALSW